jgi:hypothetical protein
MWTTKMLDSAKGLDCSIRRYCWGLKGRWALAIPQAKACPHCEVICQCLELVPEHPRTHDYTRLINLEHYFQDKPRVYGSVKKS